MRSFSHWANLTQWWQVVTLYTTLYVMDQSVFKVVESESSLIAWSDWLGGWNSTLERWSQVQYRLVAYFPSIVYFFESWTTTLGEKMEFPEIGQYRKCTGNSRSKFHVHFGDQEMRTVRYISSMAGNSYYHVATGIVQEILSINSCISGIPVCTDNQRISSMWNIDPACTAHGWIIVSLIMRLDYSLIQSTDSLAFIILYLSSIASWASLCSCWVRL